MLLLGLAPPANAVPSGDGVFYDAVYHYGNWPNGSAWIEGGTHVEGSAGVIGAGSYGLVEKGYKALRVQSTTSGSAMRPRAASSPRT